MDTEGMENGKNIELLKGEIEGTLTRLFTETGILGLIDKKDYEKVNFVGPFFGEVVSVCCGNSKTAPISEVFTQYDDLLRAIKKIVTQIQVVQR